MQEAVKCDYCGGTGEELCDRCGGSFADQSSCDPRGVPCDGYMKCVRCNGTGRMHVYGIIIMQRTAA